MIDCETPRLRSIDVSKRRYDNLNISALMVRRHFEILIMIDSNFVVNIW